MKALGWAVKKSTLATRALLVMTWLLLATGGAGYVCADDDVNLVGSASVTGNRVTESGTNSRGNNVNGSFQNFQGVANLNQASGALNNQANSVAVAVSSSGGLQKNGVAFASRVQNNTLSLADGATSNYNAVIGGQSFRGGQGIATVNQVSGNMNVQLNQVGLTIGGVAPLSGQQLSAINSNNQVNMPTSAGMNAKVKLEDGAFQNFSGVALVNQVAGNMNQVLTSVNINVR